VFAELGGAGGPLLLDARGDLLVGRERLEKLVVRVLILHGRIESAAGEGFRVTFGLQMVHQRIDGYVELLRDLEEPYFLKFLRHAKIESQSTQTHPVFTRRGGAAEPPVISKYILSS